MANKDLAKLSDQDLMKIAGAPDKSRSVNSLSDEELMKIAGTDIRSEMEDADKIPRFDAAKIGIERVVSFGFRPAIKGAAGSVGAFLGEYEKSKPNEGLSERIQRSLKAMPNAYEEVRKEAVAEEARASKDRPGYVMAGDIAGSVLTSPLVALKGLKGAAALGAAQGAGRAVSEAESLPDAALKFGEGVGYGVAGYGAAKGIEKGAKLIAPMAKEMAQKASNFMSEKAKSAFVKTASTLTGETEKNIKTFVEKNAEVNKIIADSGGDIGTAADTMRETLSKQISGFRQSMNQKIGSALDAVSPEKTIVVDDVISGLDRVKARLNNNLKPEEISQIDELADRVRAVAGEAQKVSLKELHEIQDFLQDRAKGSYLKGGQIFVPGKTSQQAAKAGAREAKIMLDKLAPEIKEANSKLFQLHKIEENINKNLIAPGKSETALLAAGGASQGRNRRYLEALGNTIGKDVIGEAEKLSSAAAFANPNLLPKSAGGTTSTTRTLVSGGLGTALGGPVGGAVSAVMTSPMVLKQAIQSGAVSKRALDQMMGRSVEMSERGLGEVVKFLNTPNGQAIFNQVLNQQRVAEGPIRRRIERISGEREK